MVRYYKYSTIFILFFIFSGLVYWLVTSKATLQARLNDANIVIAELRNELEIVRSELHAHEVKAVVSNVVEVTEQSLETIPDNLPISVGVIEGDSLSVESKQESQNAVEPEDHFSRGKHALASGYYKTAIESLKKVEQEHGQYLESRLDIANAYFFSQQYDQAATAYENLLKLAPESVEALVGLANTYNRTGKKGKQIAAYTRAISLEPEQWLHYNSRGSAFYQNGNDDRALDDFVHAAKLAKHSETDQAVALENIGLIHLRREKWLVAFQHSDIVNNIDAERSWNWLIRGIAAVKLSYSSDAWVAFENWFKYRRPTDTFLLKQFLPDPLQGFAELTPKELAKLIDPPLKNGEICVNDAQCASYYCAAGAPNNKLNYCAEKRRDCGAEQTDGYKVGQKVVIDGKTFRCYQPASGRGRWTIDESNF